jgi:hypothetical protein
VLQCAIQHRPEFMPAIGQFRPVWFVKVIIPNFLLGVCLTIAVLILLGADGGQRNNA